MKYTAKNYFIDLFIFGLSVWLPSIIYLVLYEQFKGGSDGKYDIISIISYISIALLFILPFIFGIASIILGIIGIARQEEKKAYSIFGIIVGIIGVLWAFYSTGALQI